MMYEKYFESRGVTLPDPKMCTLSNYLKDSNFPHDKHL